MWSCISISQHAFTPRTGITSLVNKSNSNVKKTNTYLLLSSSKIHSSKGSTSRLPRNKTHTTPTTRKSPFKNLPPIHSVQSHNAVIIMKHTFHDILQSLCNVTYIYIYIYYTYIYIIYTRHVFKVRSGEPLKITHKR